MKFIFLKGLCLNCEVQAVKQNHLKSGLNIWVPIQEFSLMGICPSEILGKILANTGFKESIDKICCSTNKEVTGSR